MVTAKASKSFSRGGLRELPFPVEEPPPRNLLLGLLLSAAGNVLAVWVFLGAGMAANGVLLFAAPFLLPALDQAYDIPKIGDVDLLMEFGWLQIVALALIPVGLALMLFVGPWGLRLRDRGRRLRSRDARKVLARAKRCPVLLLRSFGDESLPDPRPLNFLQRRYEERLAATLARLGPVITIGRPGDPLGYSGAARLYVADDHWQQAVRYLMTQAVAVVVIVARTEGLWWEVLTAMRAVPRDRLLFCFPYALQSRGSARRFDDLVEFIGRWNMTRRRFRRMDEERQARYRHFADRLAEDCAVELPAQLGAAQFLDFLKDGSARLLKGRRGLLFYSNLLLLLLGPRRHMRLRVDLRRTLKPFVVKTG